MIVKIFRASASFKAVTYNFDKIAKGQATLMKVSGFGALRQLNEVRPEDYRNYLEAQSALNRNVRLPQFHAMISAPDDTFDKDKLAKLAGQWLDKMGYRDQPYILIHHRDTDQSHVHMVSSRVSRKGKKIDSAFEHRRAIAGLNQLLQKDEAHQAQLDAAKALQYQCATKAQVLLLLEEMGYGIREKDDQLLLHKFGRRLFAISGQRMDESIAYHRPDKQHAVQLKAIFRKYQAVYNAVPERTTVNLSGGRTSPGNAYRSDLGDFLKGKFGIDLIFHASGDKPPYGYTIIDHTQQRVFKGSEVLKLSELIGPAFGAVSAVKENVEGPRYRPPTPSQPIYFRPYLANDVDDQQINGPRRRRQKKARTNTR
ncbi:relaxase/mobilization nuclease domain-containing protein [Mucilaginibacter sp. KACC 22063]|uniref:relaxase/mobilization nuclease domain-containing protein n=1 Tax=Mucilaginibacter sp. KACC 22063 TaxID=3025666 RepID=UPI0023667059|nr:relaxase/mobilization nuclease domain-containing protein [Mucilaginibacter sp. KACC 22063]WDF55874.1 relaxase/mobilization nuclease domain-containing protein [Mucilaginibacter sp. KACC 22063]